MNRDTSITCERLKTLHAAEIVGNVFPVLLITSLAIIRFFVPTDP